MKPLNVLEVIYSPSFGGVGVMALNIMEKLDRKKIRPIVLCFNDGPHDLQDRLDATRIDVFSAKPKNAFNAMSWHKNVSNIIKDHKVDVVHIHAEHPAIAFVARVAKRNKIPIVFHSHNTAYTIKSKSKLKTALRRISMPFIMQYTARLATARIACGSAAGKFLFGNRGFTVIKNGINVHNFVFDEKAREKTRKSFNISSTSTVLLNIGRLAHQKNQGFLLDVFNEYHKGHPDSTLLLIGDGGDKKSLQAKTDRLDLSSSVLIPGVYKDVQGLLSAADIFVLPSIHEGLPVVLVEAQVNGLPILASENVSSESNIAGTVEFYPLDKSPKEWAKKLSAMDLSRNNYAYKNIEKAGYSIDDSAKKLERIYEKVANRKTQ